MVLRVCVCVCVCEVGVCVVLFLRPELRAMLFHSEHQTCTVHLVYNQTAVEKGSVQNPAHFSPTGYSELTI